MKRWCAVLSVVVFAALSGPAPAQQPEARGSARLSAQSSGTPLPAGAEIDVTPGESDSLYGNDPLYGAVRGAVEKGLRARGFRLGGRSTLRLRMFVSAVGYGRFVSPPGPTGPQSPAGPRPRATVTDQFHVPFAVPEGVAVPSLTVSLVLHDAQGGTVLWTSTISATGRFPDPERTLAQLTRLAMAALGSSSERSFEVGCSDRTSDGLCVD